jgi:hypothetical protein
MCGIFAGMTHRGLSTPDEHPFSIPPSRDKNDPMLTFYRDTFASQTARDQPICGMKRDRFRTGGD